MIIRGFQAGGPEPVRAQDGCAPDDAEPDYC
jgi:hypothetical protein